MATPNIVPRADSEGGLGTASKGWGDSYFTGNVQILSGGASTLSKIVMGTNASKATIGIAGATDTFFTGTAVGDIVVRADDNNNKVHIGAGTSGEAGLTVTEHGGTIPRVGVGRPTALTAFDVIYDYDTTVFENQLIDNQGGGEILKYGSEQAGAIGTLHFLHTDGSWDATDADAVVTGGSQLLGIPISTDPGSHGMLLKGYYKIASSNVEGTAAIGAPVYVSEAAGKFDFTAPSGSGDFVRIVGYCIDTNDDGGVDILLYFNPDKTFVEIT